MAQKFAQLNGLPVWDAWGPATAKVWSLLAPLTLTWQDGTSDTIAAGGRATAVLLPEGTAAFDLTAHEYLVVGWQTSQTANPLSTGIGPRQLYLVRIKDRASIDSLLTTAIGSAPGWAILRWIQRTVSEDWEQ